MWGKGAQERSASGNTKKSLARSRIKYDFYFQQHLESSAGNETNRSQ